MALPWLTDTKRSDGISTEYRKPDETSDKADREDNGLKVASRDLINAIHSDSEERVAKALRAAYEILDSEPHEEAEHTNETNEQGDDK